jgi:hypothetical protein
MEPIVLFGIQFTLSLAAYGLIALWYVVPRLSEMSRIRSDRSPGEEESA